MILSASKVSKRAESNFSGSEFSRRSLRPETGGQTLRAGLCEGDSGSRRVGQGRFAGGAQRRHLRDRCHETKDLHDGIGAQPSGCRNAGYRCGTCKYQRPLHYARSCSLKAALLCLVVITGTFGPRPPGNRAGGFVHPGRGAIVVTAADRDWVAPE